MDEGQNADARSLSREEFEAAVVRIGGQLGCVWLLWAAYSCWLFGGGYNNAVGSILSFSGYALFFVLGYLTLKSQLPRGYPIIFCSCILFGLAAYSYVLIHFRSPGIGTDGLALDLAAAQTLIHGHNPYGVDLSWAFQAFHLPSTYNTPRADGTIVDSMTYPALSFLVYVPTELMRVDSRWLSFAALAAAMMLLVRFAPRGLKTLAPLVFLIDPFHVEYVVGSVQDILFVPFIMVAVFVWADVPWLAGACLGLAGAIKQEPWLDVPFLLIGIFIMSVGNVSLKMRRVCVAAAAAGVAFALPNLPFALGKPAAWTAGVLDPFLAKNVEVGVGLVNLSLSGRVPLPHWALALLASAMFFGAMFVGWRYFKTVRNALWLAPGLMLFVSPRSLENYFIYLLPVCLASWFGTFAAQSGRKMPFGRISATGLKKVAACVVALLACFASACGSTAGVHATVAKTYDTSGLGMANKLAISVRNDTVRSIAPTYLVAWSGFSQFLWRCVTGCGRLAPRSERHVFLSAPDYSAAIPSGAIAVVRVVDSSSAEEYESGRFAVAFSAVHLLNACLCGTKDLGYLVPAGWTISKGDLASGDIAYATGAPAGRLTLRVGPVGVRGWTFRSVYQKFVPFAHPIAARVSKDVLYRGGADPTQYAGIAVADELGHFVLFGWGDVPRTVTYARKGLFVIEPVDKGAQSLAIDFEKYRRAAGVVASGQLTIRLVVAALAPKGNLAATFSGFDLIGNDNRLGPASAAFAPASL
ncbi:MAG: DUF2029 domain-containing protein [Candidatus Eremiobacteraeota bacterium]|nr:DUF2029 domain-containing protein [Candidatus Eremiobacteraeota bacterium]